MVALLAYMKNELAFGENLYNTSWMDGYLRKTSRGTEISINRRFPFGQTEVKN